MTTKEVICEFVLSRLEWERGDLESSIAHAQRSLDLAKRCSDLTSYLPIAIATRRTTC